MLSKPKKLDTLTSARFLAALGVVLYHYSSMFTNNLGITSAPPWWQLLLWQGGLGVDFFFLLSGFILAYTYALPDSGLRGTKRAFWVARFARVYPVYLVGLALDVVPFLGRHHHVMGLIASAIAVPSLVHAWIPFVIDAKAWNPPSWSLSVEAFFYLLFPFVIIWLACLSRRVLIPLVVGFFVLFALLPLPLILIGTYHGHVMPWWFNYIIMYDPLMRLPEFLVGSALGLLFLRRTLPHATANVSLYTHAASDVILVALIAVAIVLCLLPIRLPPSYPFGVLLVPVLAAIIYLLAHQRGLASRVLSWPWLVWLGEISYGIYIVHWPLWSWISLIATTYLHLSITSPVLLVAYLGLTLAVAAVSYHLIEGPARRAIRTRWTSSELRTVAAEVTVPVAGSAR